MSWVALTMVTTTISISGSLSKDVTIRMRYSAVQVTRNSITNVSGIKDLKYNIGFSHNDEKSIMQGSGYAKNNVNAKINANLNKWLSLDFNGRMAFTKLDGLNGGADTNESSAANSVVANTVRWSR